MLRRTSTARAFHIGTMFHDAAARDDSLRIILDQPVRHAPGEGLSLTVGHVAELVDKLAGKLAAVGVQPRDKVAIFKTDNIDIVLLACAAARIGAIPALLSPGLEGGTAVELIRRLDHPWLVTDRDTLDGALAGADVDGITREVLVSAGTGGRHTALAHVTGSRTVEPVLPHPREPALITHSSGTTGVPKLAVHCANSLWHRLLPQQLMALPLRGRETVALCMTFVHSRFYNALGVFLAHGNPMVIAQDWRPEVIGPLFTAHRPGYVETQPNTYIEWEDLADEPAGPLSNVRCFGATFDAVHPRTIQRLLAASRRHNPLFIQLYGQSETGPVAGRWYTRRNAAKADGRTVGMPLPGFVRLRVTGPDGRRVPRGEVGHLEVKLRSRILTYHGEDQRYQEQLNDGWWRLGDMGFLDRFGMLHMLDREVDRIDSMSSSLEVEDVLMSRLPELREVVIIAGRDGSPVPVVCTRRGRPLDPERWRHATADLEPMAGPVLIPFADIPRTSTWKVRRSRLAAQLADMQ